jgi:pyruvate,orthophosphate dikinase
MSSDSARFVYDFDAPPPLAADELRALLGGKAANLVVMASELGLPVPPGFTVTTEVCGAYLAGAWPAGLDEELREHMARLESVVDRRFGDAVNPLLVSVRSGAPVSMPGMMDTILNLGLNAATAEGLARTVDDADFAADCLRRFRDGYRAVIGDESVPDDVWIQLRAAVEAVFRSWNSDRARAYRQRDGITDDLGTAVTVQAMVFGNRGEDSGTGVLFTRNPSTGEKALYGDIMFNAQGEDVVAGTHATQPIAVLASRLPEVGAQLRRYADVLERHHADLCDIEFTIEQGRLWMLQMRVGKRSPRAALRMAIDMAEEAGFPLTREEAVHRVAALLADPPRVFVAAGELPVPIARGLPASPGVATGEIVTSSEAAERAAAEGGSVILVRSETSPEDVRGMAKSAGILTARGGLASHAAVVARGWGIPAVVGADEVVPRDGAVVIAGQSLPVGERITIDGSTGAIYRGELPGEWQVAPEVTTLLEWAKELWIPISSTPADSTASAESTTDMPHRQLTADDVLQALAIMGAVARDALVDALQATPGAVNALLERLVADRLVEPPGAGVRLTAEGKLAAARRFAADRADVGETRTAELLEEFHDLDGRMKTIVTAWQIREVGGEQVLNDHTDAAYDQQVLDDLATLHAETGEWLSPLATQMRRFDVYRSRLSRAIELAQNGDQRYVASPRVDSYHSVWFELHEDLIRLAGRRRADEA